MITNSIICVEKDVDEMPQFIHNCATPPPWPLSTNPVALNNQPLIGAVSDKRQKSGRHRNREQPLVKSHRAAGWIRQPERSAPYWMRQHPSNLFFSFFWLFFFLLPSSSSPSFFFFFFSFWLMIRIYVRAAVSRGGAECVHDSFNSLKPIDKMSQFIKTKESERSIQKILKR